MERFVEAVVWRPGPTSGGSEGEGLAGLATELGLPADAGLDVAGAGPAAGAGAAARRAEALAALDAAHAVLLGFSRRDLELALAAFPGLARRERATFGHFRTGELALAAYDRLLGAPGEG